MNVARQPPVPISRRAVFPTLAVGAAAACDTRGAANAEDVTGYALASAAFPVFVVSSYYGGTLGQGDDQKCIQSTMNAASAAGGGRVVLPPRADGYVYKYNQLVVPRFVLLSGVGWHTFGAEGTIARMEQLPGVNDDSIIFSDNGNSSDRPFIGPSGITDLAIRATANGTAGHGISFRVPDGRIGLAQDMTTLERLVIRGFPGSGIYSRGGSPLRLDYITTLWNGRYGVEVEDTKVDRDSGSVHQLTMKHISGDGNMGGEADGGGGTVLLKGLMAKKASVTLIDIKSEYRIRPAIDSGDGVAMGNFHAIVVEDCACPITVTGVEHIATGSQDRLPGNAIQVKGTQRPDLLWQSVTVRDDHPSQTVGRSPFRVFDEVLSRGSRAPHGAMGVSTELYAPAQLATHVDTERPDELANGESTLLRRAITSDSAQLAAETLRLTYFTARKSEAINRVRTCTGTTAALGASLCRIGVYEADEDGHLTLVASTANTTSLWSAASTAYTEPFSDSFVKKRGVRYAVAQLIVGASTPPTLLGQTHLLADEAAQPPRLCGVLSSLADLPVRIPAESIGATAIQVYAALMP